VTDQLQGHSGGLIQALELCVKGPLILGKQSQMSYLEYFRPEVGNIVVFDVYVIL